MIQFLDLVFFCFALMSVAVLLVGFQFGIGWWVPCVSVSLGISLYNLWRRDDAC